MPSVLAPSPGKTDLSPWLDEPGYLPREDEALMMFGADPAWTPERERYRLADRLGHYEPKPLPGSAKGHTELPKSCPVCGGTGCEEASEKAADPDNAPDPLDPNPRPADPDPIPESEVKLYVCGRCGRTHHEGRLRGTIDPGQKRSYNRPGKRIARVKGKPDHRYNAYLPEPKPGKPRKPRHRSAAEWMA